MLTYEEFSMGLDNQHQEEPITTGIPATQELTANYVPGEKRILLVDDEDSIIATGVRILRNLGYSAIGKTSSAEALQLFQEYPEDFDMVIVDFIMPEMTGEVLAEEILKVRWDIPIIMITGYNEVVNEKKLKEIGIQEIFPKPFSKHQLASYIRNVLDDNGLSE